MFNRMATVALLSISLAGAKTYSFDISRPARAGNFELARGMYKIRVDGSKAVLMDRRGHEINVAARAEAADIKFDRTAVILSSRLGKLRLEGVQLGGVPTRVVFEKGQQPLTSIAAR